MLRHDSLLINVTQGQMEGKKTRGGPREGRCTRLVEERQEAQLLLRNSRLYLYFLVSNRSLFLMPVCFGARLPYEHYAANFLGARGQCKGLKTVKSSSYGELPIHLFRHFSCRMYRLATASQTNGKTDRDRETIVSCQ